MKCITAASCFTFLLNQVHGVPIRGVNIGGWLVLERWIKPSLMTSCMVEPPEKNPSCFWGKDVPVDEWTYCAKLKEMGRKDGVGDDYLMQRLTEHWDSWVSYHELNTLKQAGVTHLRVPFGHWILGDISQQDREPYVSGEWPFLLRLLGWARTLGLEVWLDLHTAPGSQNGFDNSGHLGQLAWPDSEESVARTVRIVGSVARGVKAEGFQDVVTGFGLVNEPGPFVPVPLLLNFYEDGYSAVRAHLGPQVNVYVGDGFNALNYQDFWAGSPLAVDATKGHLSKESIYKARYPLVRQGGGGGGGGGGDGVVSSDDSDDKDDASSSGGSSSIEPPPPPPPPPTTTTTNATATTTVTAVEVMGALGGDASGGGGSGGGLGLDQGVALAARTEWWDVTNVALDTHMYQCFTRSMRSFSPKQHVGQVCGLDRLWLDRCCHGANHTGSELARLVGEWTVAYDQEPGVALESSSGPVREMTTARLDFLRSFAMAQIVNYEEGVQAAPAGEPPNKFLGWFFWNFKMENKMYQEWDFLSGLEAGWMPQLDPKLKASQMFGSCQDILAATPDSLGVVDPFPPESWYKDNTPTLAPVAPPPFSWPELGVALASLLPLAALFWGLWWVCARHARSRGSGSRGGSSCSGPGGFAASSESSSSSSSSSSGSGSTGDRNARRGGGGVVGVAYTSLQSYGSTSDVSQSQERQDGGSGLELGWVRVSGGAAVPAVRRVQLSA